MDAKAVLANIQAKAFAFVGLILPDREHVLFISGPVFYLLHFQSL